MHSRRPLLMKTARLTSMRYVFATFTPPRRASCMNSKEFEYCFHFVSSLIKVEKIFSAELCRERKFFGFRSWLEGRSFDNACTNEIIRAPSWHPGILIKPRVCLNIFYYSFLLFLSRIT